ncbi:hypothetical protein [Clostridium sp. DJ247]|uniref:hypothetical protein n=1 Tax=Clostridium sp. DJ247 TaxID=2726188 RepID=UPI001627F7E2|nr:hypothetical protein [Clostridium sp. DJ247]MBC2581155.1 hypothetical protein [Clostridium sp. DJ247]
MDKRKIRTAMLVILTLLIFGLSYYICINKLLVANIKNNKQFGKNINDKSNSLTVNTSINGEVSANANVVFKIKYNKSGELFVEKEQLAGALAGKRKSELEELYKDQGYKVQGITQDQVVLVRETDKYAPNKYVLGIKDEYIAIYKTDKDGNMFIEDKRRDITDIKIDKLKQADVQLLTNGDKYFECDTREDAQARLEDYE